MTVRLNQQETKIIKRSRIYDKSTLRVIVLACLSITFAVFFMGLAGYRITERAVIDKLKNQDLGFIVQSIASKVDGRITRAKETSLIMADDPLLLKWVSAGQSDPQIQSLSQEKIKQIAHNYDYNNTFVVSAITHQYWSEAGLIDGVSPDNPNDQWFFDTIQSKQRITINVDYNKERNDTYVFVNTLMGDLENPVAITGVGLDLKDLTQEFEGYKFGKESSLWLIDSSGIIHMADDYNDRGKNVRDLLQGEVSAQIIKAPKSKAQPKITEFRNEEGQVVDLAYQSIESANWQLVLLIPRAETVGFLNTIKVDTLLTSLFALIVVSLVFFWLSNWIANPLRRALQLSKEMEEQVEQRTQEIKQQNIKIMDSIDYAKRLQETLIPSPAMIEETFKEWFVLWQPRDTVGGDFYWLKQVGNTRILAVGDCTGHGVPGALMTMAVIPMLNHVLEEMEELGPAEILSRLNRMMRLSFHKKDRSTDDGLDLGICIMDGETLRFAGAKIDLYIKKQDNIQSIRGNRHSIGYRKSDERYQFSNHLISIENGDTFYLTTDGFLDQNGGPKDYSLGKKRFIRLLQMMGNLPLVEQRQFIKQALKEYQQDNDQRDDITVLGFTL